MNFLSIFSKIYKGNEGEAEVLASIAKLLNVNKTGEENYFLIPKSTLKDINGSREVDLLLLHPVLGIYAIEVKNWESLDYIDSKNDPFKQANIYQDLLLATLQNKFGRVPVNVEYRVIFPRITIAEGEVFFKANPYYENFRNHTFFKEHLEDKNIFKRFFNASNAVTPNKKTFLSIASMLVPTDKLKNRQEQIIPVITKDEILFFDQKQLSVLNGYTGGFRIIRGVAGTGKTIILINFVNSRLIEDGSEKFLILCFNRNLVEATKKSFGDDFQKKNVAILSIHELIDRIGFDYVKAGIDKNNLPFNKLYEAFETDKALHEFREKFRIRLQKKPIDYFLCDETQDMPAGFMRIIYEEIADCIFFIDEAQRFYPFTMQNIAEVFHHPKFEKISMRGRVKNLKNVYRTPSNIAKTAFEILSHDTSLNDYYKRSYYLNEGFTKDINMVLEEGTIVVGKWDQFTELKKLLHTLPKDEENVVLAFTKPSLIAINDIVKSINAESYIEVMMMQSVKGLEAQNVVIHNFGRFIMKNFEKNPEIVYRQIYVLLTRAQERLYLSLDNIEELISQEKTKKIYKILEQVSKEHKVSRQGSMAEDKNSQGESKLRLAKLKPVIQHTKEKAEMLVVAGELFLLIGEIFA